MALSVTRCKIQKSSKVVIFHLISRTSMVIYALFKNLYRHSRDPVVSVIYVLGVLTYFSITIHTIR